MNKLMIRIFLVNMADNFKKQMWGKVGGGKITDLEKGGNRFWGGVVIVLIGFFNHIAP